VISWPAELRAARIGHAPAIARLSRDAIERGLPWRWQPRAIAGLIREPDTEVVVAADPHSLVGFAAMRFLFERREAHLLLMAVRASARRQGVGRALFQWLDGMARLAGIREYRLEVRVGNEGSQAFYQSLGFRPHGRLENYYAGREDALQMRRTR